MLKNYFKVAFRHLSKNRTYTTINVLGLALSITCTIIIYVFVSYELNFDAFHSQSENTYRVVEHSRTADGTQYRNTTAYPLAEALQQDFPGVDVTQAVGPIGGMIGRENSDGQIGRFEENNILFVDSNYLHVFDFKNINEFWVAGNPQTAFTNPNSIVLTKPAVEKYFPSIDSQYGSVIGETLQLNDQDLLTVTGVLQKPPANINLQFQVLIPYEFFESRNQYVAGDWSGNHQGTTFITLPESGNIAGWESQINMLKDRYMDTEHAQRTTYYLQPITDIHTETLYGNSIGSYVIDKNTLMVLIILAGFLIAIACFNYINLTTAISTRRFKEMSIRRISGGTRPQIITQIMVEVLIITILAVLFSIACTEWVLNYISQSISIINLDLNLDVSVILFSIILIVVITCLAGLYPAFSLTNGKTRLEFQKQTHHKSSNLFSIRQGLIVIQFSIACLLILGTMVITQQMHFIRNVDPGFARDASVIVDIPDQSYGKLNLFEERLLQNPAIENVSFSSGPPTTNGRQYGTGYRLNREHANQMRDAELKVVDLNYFELFDLNILAGSWLTEANVVEGFNGFVVNETLVRSLGMEPENAIGEIIVINEGRAPIVGVVEDFHNNSFQYEITPCLMFYWGGVNFFDRAVIQFQDATLNSQSVNDNLQFIEEVWKDIFPVGIYGFQFLDDYMAQNYKVENFLFYSVNVLSVISFFIACLGLFGLASFTAERRKKEIGIRKVLGASIATIVVLLNKDFLKLATIGFLLAIPFAWYAMNRWLQEFTYRIEIGYEVFLVSGTVAILIAMLVVSWQTIRASIVNPVHSLRSE